MKGNGLTPSEIKDFLQSSYEVNAPKQINDYILDEELSNLYGKVYVNENLKKVILAFRGTGSENYGTDWINNLVFVANSTSYKLTPRFRTAVKMYQMSMNKYKGYKFELLGHSQSGVIVNNLCSDKVGNCISLNPAYKHANLNNNEYIIRSTGDMVSKLVAPKRIMNTVLYPKWSKKHMINIEDKTGNPITEHKVDILDRLNPNLMIGRGNPDDTKKKTPNDWVTFVKKYSQENNISYGCAISEAGPAYKKMKGNKKNPLINKFDENDQYTEVINQKRRVIDFFEKHNGKYKNSRIESKKEAKTIYNNLVSFFPNDKYTLLLKQKLKIID